MADLIIPEINTLQGGAGAEAFTENHESIIQQTQAIPFQHQTTIGRVWEM